MASHGLEGRSKQRRKKNRDKIAQQCSIQSQIAAAINATEWGRRARGVCEGVEGGQWVVKRKTTKRHQTLPSAKRQNRNRHLSIAARFFQASSSRNTKPTPKKASRQTFIQSYRSDNEKETDDSIHFFFFECVRVYNIYIFIYIFIFLYVYNLTRAHTHMSMKKTHRLTKKQALEKGWQSLHIFFFPLQKMQGRAKE